jgi:rSAM/selenodomain-associated transferase 1
VTVLVVAKAPVAGLAKTRLASAIGAQAAADIAAAALLDTLDAVAATPVAARVVAMTGDLDAASGSAEIRDRLRDFTVIAQRGNDFADRLANAHADAAAAAGAHPVLQIGMDTPQVTAELLTHCAETLLRAPVVLGMAGDGGWWVLGVRSASMADVLREVPMSQHDTGELTLQALRDEGFEVSLLQELDDVDTVDDIAAVRLASAPDGRFSQTMRAVGIGRAREDEQWG